MYGAATVWSLSRMPTSNKLVAGLFHFVQICVRVHEASGSPRLSFELMCGSMRCRGLRDPPLKSCTDPWGFGVSATRNQIYFLGPCGFRVTWDLVQIYVQVHEISGSPGTSFKLICRPMRFQGPLGPPLHLYAGPWGCKVPWDLFQNYLQAHEISGARGTSFTFICSPLSFRGLLDPPSN